MALSIQALRLIAPALACGLFAAVLGTVPVPAMAHQLSHPNGALVPHQHVFKRNAYGDGFVVGHVVPTRHGHNMIIWSPAPSNAFGTPMPQVQIAKPNRQRQLHPQRAAPANEQLRNLRQLDPRNQRR